MSGCDLCGNQSGHVAIALLRVAWKPKTIVRIVACSPCGDIAWRTVTDIGNANPGVNWDVAAYGQRSRAIFKGAAA